jgi:PhzF family phenazine biosynthesis protein
MPPVFHVDAFADRPFTGNPAAVCLLTEPGEAGWMQRVAAEMHLSETAFLSPREGGWDLRWFTPAVEVNLCGHATLASAHVLWETGRLGVGARARFHTRSGWLEARQDGATIVLDFPAKVAKAARPPRGLLGALGVPAQFVGRSEYDFLVEVDAAEVVRSVRPDFARLAQIPVRGVIVTSRSDDPAFDFVSRFFAPASGVNEDPVTGSAHCTLGPFWQERLGRDRLVAWQASARGGRVAVRVVGDRVELGGCAVTTARGELLCAPDGPAGGLSAGASRVKANRRRQRR